MDNNSEVAEMLRTALPQATRLALSGLAFVLAAIVTATAAPAASERIVYSFQSGSDGQRPGAGLLNVGNVLYGTTGAGGAFGHGTVFKVTRDGAETVLHSFQGGSDGSTPAAALINVNGILYGTTYLGGGLGCTYRGCGTVYKITLEGAETVVHAFKQIEGQRPEAPLLDVRGTLYGTTSMSGRGATAFTIAPDGTETLVHRFPHAWIDAGLIDVGGKLYGTTTLGPDPGGDGMVFEMTRHGAVTELYRFPGGASGGIPHTALRYMAGALYGTTVSGGDHNAGTVFSLAPPAVAGGTWTETVIHSFDFGDGSVPEGALTSIGTTLYGTTAYGSGSTAGGTVFALSQPTSTGAAWTETVLHVFKDIPDGANPYGKLIHVKDKLYGTTYGGGMYGYGTVFEITP